MYRYERIFVLPCLALVCLSVFSGFCEKEDGEWVEKLLQQRTDILQQVYYGGISAKEAERLLAAVETQPLLGQDVVVVRRTGETDLDRVERMEVTALQPQSLRYDYQAYEAKVCWHMQGVSSYRQTVTYLIVLKGQGRESKLSMMELR